MTANQPHPVVVDDRYTGNHGIARYSREIIPRLQVKWTSLKPSIKPTTAIDAINPHRLKLAPSTVLYSPGYSSGVARCTQLLTIHDLIHIRSELDPANALKRIYYEQVVKRIVKNARHVLTVSETSACDIRAWIDDGRVMVHNAGIGCSNSFTINGEVQELGQPYLLFVGNLKPHKNPRLLFECMHYFPDHLLVATVPAHDIGHAHDLAAQYGFSKRLIVHSNIPDRTLASFYRGADALVYPSLWEGFGLPVLEALKTGTKVVYYREASSVAEICAGGQFPFDGADDPEQLRDQIINALNSPFVCTTDLSQFEWKRVAENVTKTIKMLTEG